MINQRKIGKQKPLPKVKSDEIPWSLPKNWLWCRLGEVTAYGLTEKAEYPDVEKNTWVLELEDIEKGTSRLIQRVTAKDRKFKSTKKKFFKGNILYGKLRPYLDKVIIADADGVCTTEIIPIYSFYGIDPEYLRWYLKSPFFREYANSSTHGMNLPRLGTEKARSALFALPPLREQKSCVAIINELMALFEKLEAQQQKRESLCKLIRTAILNALANSQTPEELQPAWKRLRENIHLLFDTPESVGEIRKSILMLAVTGKLTEKTTLSAKDYLINIKKDYKQPSINADLIKLIPDNWCWSRFKSIARIQTNLKKPEDYPDLPHIAPNNIEKNSGRLLYYNTVSEDNIKSNPIVA